MVLPNLPKCQRCGKGDLVPLSDYTREGTPIPYKAWACTNPKCRFVIKIRGKGEVEITESSDKSNEQK